MFFGGQCLPCCGTGCSEERALQTWLALQATPLRCTVSGAIPSSDQAVSGRAFATSFRVTGGVNDGKFISGQRVETTPEAFLNNSNGTTTLYYVDGKSRNEFGTYDLAVDLTPRPQFVNLESDYTQWKPPFEWSPQIPPFGYVRYVHSASQFTLIVTLRVDAIAASEGLAFANSACRVTGTAYAVTQRRHATETVAFGTRLSTSVESYGTLRVARGSWAALGSTFESASRVYTYCNNPRIGTQTYYDGYGQSPGKPDSVPWQDAIESRCSASLGVLSPGLLSGSSPVVYGLAPHQWLPFSWGRTAVPAWAASVKFDPTSWSGGGGFPDSIQANWCAEGVAPASSSFVRPAGAQFGISPPFPPEPRGVPADSNISSPLLTGGSPPGVTIGFSVSPA